MSKRLPAKIQVVMCLDGSIVAFPNRTNILLVPGERYGEAAVVWEPKRKVRRGK